MALVPVGVHCTFKNFAGALADGMVVFKPVDPALDAVIDTAYAPLPIEVDVEGGEMQVTLMAPASSSDDPIAYRVTEDFVPRTPGSNRPTYTILLPGGASDGAVFELADRDETGLLPLPDSAGDTSGVFGDDGTFG